MLSISQIHQYMLSRAPHFPELSPSNDTEENPSKRKGDAQTSSQEAEVAPLTEAVPSLPVEDEIVEEQQEVLANDNPSLVGLRAMNEVPSDSTRNQMLQKPQTRVRKPADDSMFTWAAVGLTIAIVVLLLKKFLKSSGYGAVFMDGS